MYASRVILSSIYRISNPKKTPAIRKLKFFENILNDGKKNLQRHKRCRFCSTKESSGQFRIKACSLFYRWSPLVLNPILWFPWNVAKPCSTQPITRTVILFHSDFLFPCVWFLGQQTDTCSVLRRTCARWVCQGDSPCHNILSNDFIFDGQGQSHLYLLFFSYIA